MVEETAESEGKFKIKFESIDKRFTNLELALGEFSEKISKIPSADQNIIAEINHKIGEIEDLINVEQLGVVELKKIMTSIDEKFEQSKSFLKSAGVESELLNLQLKMQQMGIELEKMIQKSESEIETLRSKAKLLDPEVISKIVKEVTETRSELSKDIREIKEKMHSQDSTRSEIDMKFLKSRVDSLKENIDFLMNRKAEFDQKIGEIEKNLADTADMKSEFVGEEFFKKLDLSKKDLIRINTRIDNLERELHRQIEKLSLTGSLKVSPSDVYSTLEIEKRVGILEEKLKDMNNRIAMTKVTNLDMQIEELLEKIVDVETRLIALEKTFVEPKKSHPVVLE